MPASTLATVPLSALLGSEDNVRSNLGDLEELAESIRAVGVLEPLIVAPNGGKAAGSFTIIAGHRRFAAAGVAGLSEIPVIIREASQAERAEIMLIENLQRDDLSPLDEARAYRRLIDAHGYEQKRIAERVGRSPAHVSKRLAMLELPEPALKKIDSGVISVTDAQALAKIADHPDKVTSILQEIGDSRVDREWGIAELVDDAVREIEQEEAFAKLVEEAELDAAPYLESPRPAHGYGSWRLPKGALLLGKNYGELQITIPKHRPFPCHGVTVRPEHGYGPPALAYLCTTPANHPAEVKASDLGGNRGGLTEEEKKRRKKVRDHREALEMAEEFRRTFLRERVISKATADQTVEALLAALLHPDWGYRPDPSAEIALQLLGLTVAAGAKSPNPEDEGLLSHAGASKVNAARVGLALAYSVQEQRLLRTGWVEEAKAYFEELGRLGYQLDAAEKLELAGRAPR